MPVLMLRSKDDGFVCTMCGLNVVQPDSARRERMKEAHIRAHVAGVVQGAETLLSAGVDEDN